MAWIALLSLCLTASAPQQGTPAAEARIEYFTLEARAEHPVPGREHAVVGAARWTRDVGHHGGRYLELDLYLLGEDARLLLTEETYPEPGPTELGTEACGAKLVWREFASEGRRMLVVERPVERPAEPVAAPWRFTDGSGGDLLRGEHRFDGEVAASVLWPLAWAEDLRHSERTDFRTRLFSPLANGLETVEVRAAALPGPFTAWFGAGPEDLSSTFDSVRRIDSVRSDGSRHRRFWFAGDDLIAFQLGEGGPVAVRTNGESYRAIVPKFARVADSEPIAAEASAPRTPAPGR